MNTKVNNERDKIFSLSFGGWIGDLCKSCFVGRDFVLLGREVCVVVCFCLDYLIEFLFILNLLSWCLVKFGRV